MARGRDQGREERAMFGQKVLVADEAIWVREGSGVRKISWSEVLDVRVEKAGFWSPSEKLVIQCRKERISVPLTEELADKVRVRTLTLGRAGASHRK